MNRICTLLFSAYVGWTLACHLSTICHWSLIQCMVIAPIFMVAAYVLARPRDNIPIQMIGVPSGLRIPLVIAPCAIVLVVISVCFSWTSFWLGSIVVLSAVLYAERRFAAIQEIILLDSVSTIPAQQYEKWTVAIVCVFVIIFTLFANRSDLDDAFYVSVAAFAHAHPNAPLLASDPMFGKSNLPLIFPSYQFTSYELLGAAIAWLFNVPAMDVIYRFFAPMAALIATLSIFFCSKQIYAKGWLAVGVITIALLLVLGEDHRSIGNFGFVRIFQGKAIYLSAMVPLIYGLSFRYCSPEGTSRDLLLLLYAQLAAIGLSNFAPLAAPMAGLTAALAAHPIDNRNDVKKFLTLCATCTISLPYLAWIAWRSHDASVLANDDLQSAASAWTEVFGPRQQFLIASMLLLGPLLTRNRTLRWRLAVPYLVLLVLLLNPWLATFIAKRVTTPPVYWRVTWDFPLTVFLATSIIIFVHRIREARHERLLFIALFASISLAVILLFSLGGNVARSSNHVQWRFATRKVDANDMAVAEEAMRMTHTGKILAPDNIAGLIPIHEEHPELVNVRGTYLSMLENAMSPSEFEDRMQLTLWIESFNSLSSSAIRALNDLDVTTVVTKANPEQPSALNLLVKAHFARMKNCSGYVLWVKTPTASQQQFTKQL